ncbi:RNA 2',3'-cyclic phosphodiesterase [Ruminococcaceae bacterium OttesenSCG-928-I18]|nr:RNA 2',3'-cyclic phosphodiesterase [Ruminococcaceae bacterium OttesenSCG-928-I18]
MRLFYAIRPSEECLGKLWEASGALRGQVERGSFTRRENLHLTVLFLGETEHREKAEACLHEIMLAPFELCFASLGRFRRGEGDLLWAGVKADPVVQQLYNDLSARLRKAGFQVEARPYVPHLTLARRVRFAAGTEFATLEKHVQPCCMQADALLLMRSHRVEGQLRYTELARQDLRPR